MPATPSHRLPLTLVGLALFCIWVSSSAWASEAEMKALATIRELDSQGKLAEAAGSIQRLGKSRDPHVQAESLLYQARILVAANHLQEAFLLLAKARELEITGTELWAKLTLDMANGLRAQSILDRSLLFYQEVTLHRPHGIIGFQAAVGCGDLLAQRGDLTLAAVAYHWAKDLAERELYDEATRKKLDLESLWAKIARLKRDEKASTITEDAELFARAERHRHARQWADALATYAALIKRFPDSPHVPMSGWATGACLAASGENAKALESWAQFISANPLGEFRGLAWAGIIDIHLLHHLDPDTARDCAESAWASLVSRQSSSPDPLDETWKQAGYELSVRKGLLLCLSNDYEKAQQWFQRALLFRPPPKREVSKSGWEPLPSSTERLIARCSSGQPLSPAEALDQRYAKAGLLLFLGDFAYECGDRQEAAGRFAQLTSRTDLKSSAHQRAYAWLRLGESRHWFANQDDVGVCYATCLSQYPQSPWVARTLVLRGIWEYSQKKLPQKALTTFADLANRFPDTQQAQSALWFVGVIHYWDSNWSSARTAWNDLNRRYPDNEWKALISDQYLPTIEANLKKQEKKP